MDNQFSPEFQSRETVIPQFPRDEKKPRHPKPRAPSVKLFNQLNKEYYIKIGCTDCPTLENREHKSCRANCILLSSRSARNKDLVIVRQRSPKYKMGAKMCEQIESGKCFQKVKCPFPHNTLEESLWKTDKDMSLTDFIKDMRTSQLRVTCLVSGLQGRFAGKLTLACKICQTKESHEKSRKKTHVPVCTAGHPWEDNKTFMFTTTDNEEDCFQVFESNDASSANYDVVSAVRCDIEDLMESGVTLDDIVFEAKRLEQEQRSLKAKKDDHSRNKRNEFSLAKHILRENTSRVRCISICSDSSDKNDPLDMENVRLDADSDLESLYDSDGESDDDVDECVPGSDTYYSLESNLNILMSSQSEKYKKCSIHLKGTSEAICHTLDGHEEIQIRGRMNCGPCFDGDQVLVEIIEVTRFFFYFVYFNYVQCFINTYSYKYSIWNLLVETLYFVVVQACRPQFLMLTKISIICSQI